MNITTILEKDHDTVRKLLEQCESLEDGAEQKRRLIERIAQELRVHTELEEELFYRELERAGSRDAGEMVQEAIEEHQEVEQILVQLIEMSPDGEGYDGLVTELREAVEHHVQEEESEMFDLAREHLSEDRLVELGDEMQSRRKETQREVVEELRAEREAAEEGRKADRPGAGLEED